MYCRSVLRGKHLGFANAIVWTSTIDHDVRTPGVYYTIIIAAAESAPQSGVMVSLRSVLGGLLFGVDSLSDYPSRGGDY